MVIDPFVLDEVLLRFGSTGHIRDGHLYLCFAGQDTFVKADEKQQNEVFLACEVRAKELVLENKYKSLSAHIYAQYPPEKQAQDTSNAIDFPTRLKASGIDGLEKTVVDVITAVHFGQPLEGLITNVVQGWVDTFYTPPTLPEGVKPLTNKQLQVHKEQTMADWSWQLAKLVKIGLRTNWKDACVRAGKAAIAEGREPEFPPFPKM